METMKEVIPTIYQVIDSLYEKHVNLFMKGYKEEKRKFVKLLDYPIEDAEKDIKEQEEFFKEQIKFSDKVRNITNNFFVKFPNGWARDLDSYQEDEEKVKMFKDIDEIIKEKGYSEIELNLVSNQELESNDDIEKRAHILIYVYMEMIKKDYTRDDLWK